jgi:hypothetical protein
MKRPVFFSMLAILLAIFISCDLANDVSGGDIEEGFQVYFYDDPAKAYTGGGTVYSGEEEIILGSITGGKLTLNLPETVPYDKLSEDWQFAATVIVSADGLRTIGMDFDDGFYVEDGGSGIEVLYNMKETKSSTDLLSYVYSNMAVTILGTETYDNVAQTWNLNLQPGWNKMWVHLNGPFENGDYESTTSITLRTDLTGMPSDLRWLGMRW